MITSLQNLPEEMQWGWAEPAWALEDNEIQMHQFKIVDAYWVINLGIPGSPQIQSWISWSWETKNTIAKKYLFLDIALPFPEARWYINHSQICNYAIYFDLGLYNYARLSRAGVWVQS